ncbi:MAG: DUF2063 domain-containing protein [Gammaproteobacteria bacterium]|nr:DUF2063 domain-containing protein [Gammaproteobacteria bacterium]
MHGKAERPQFQQLQYAFTAHIRDPEANPRPADIEARRMKIYNELTYNNVEDFMASTYPVLREICGDEKWHRLMRDYFANHYAGTPFFHEMPREFLKYLEQEHDPAEDDFPFMLELAHYEWVELALSVSDQQTDHNAIDPDGDLLDGVPVLSPLAWPLNYQFPVHKLSSEYMPVTAPAQPTYLVVYRDVQDAVRFLEMNPVTAHLVQLIAEGAQRTGRELLTQIAEQLQHADPALVIQSGQQILHDLRERGILLGVIRA